jgi:Ca2+-transporting ATPase
VKNLLILDVRAAGVLFFVLFFRFVADLPNHPERNGAMKGKEFVDILIVAVTVIVVAIPGKLLYLTV